MKRIVSLLLVLCLVLGVASVALAAGAPKITKQPESAVTDKKGTVTFQIKLKNFKNGGITWKLINPATGEIINASKISTVFKDVKVSGPNGYKLTLKKVPNEMHGWSVYCHISQNGYTVDSDIVELRTYEVENGLVTPAPAEEAKPEEQPQEQQPEQPAEEPQPQEQQPVQPAEEPQPQEQQPEQPAEETQPQEQQPEQPAEEPQPQEQQPEQPAEPEGPGYTLDSEGDVEEDESIITINGENVSLYPLDSRGNVIDEIKASTLTFENSGSIMVVADGPVSAWIIDGMRFEPVEQVSGFTLKNITHSLDISAVLQQVSASAADVDDTVKFTVTCEGCTFTYLKGDLQSVTSGAVPAGASVTVMADTADLANRGYSVNGADPSHEGQASFRLKITEDTSIVCK